jgi:hypothetical protein
MMKWFMLVIMFNNGAYNSYPHQLDRTEFTTREICENARIEYFRIYKEIYTEKGGNWAVRITDCLEI